MFELGGGSLTAEEQLRIKKALETESARLRSVALDEDSHEDDLAGDR
jgi:hypothetical protein